MMDRWFKKRRISTGYNQSNILDRPFQSGGTDIMARDELLCRVIETGQKLMNLGRWSWMLLQEKNNVRTRIIITYYLAESVSVGGAYI